MKKQYHRAVSFFAVAIIYAAAAALGIFVYRNTGGSPLVRLFLADVAATLLVYLFSLPLGNASVYDPYWSVAPVVILPLAIAEFGRWNFGSVCLLFCVGYWGLRLTANWAYTFRGLDHQDWRYSMLKEKSGALYPLVSLFGIMLFPTVVVFLCLLPALKYIQSGAVSLLTCAGFALCLSAATLQLVADLQMHRFQKSAHSRADIIRSGVWKHSRHPNYLGEILMWWGVFLVMVSALPQYWYFAAGALVNTLMFQFISIPMAENRLAGYKEGFADYVSETNKLLPFARRKSA
jgi:steroid 5-alpha reductase family enzyme